MTLDKGEFVLVVGRTGSGKTTLFRLISMELQPDSGEIVLMEIHSSRLRQRDLPHWRRQLGIVFQDLRLLDDRSVLENVKLAALCDRRLPENPKVRSLRVLGKVEMSYKLQDRPNQLSTGEQQRIAIARALVNEPYVLLADEPVSNLDSETSKTIVDILYKISLSGTAVIVATHQPERFESINPRIIRMDRGSIIDS